MFDSKIQRVLDEAREKGLRMQFTEDGQLVLCQGADLNQSGIFRAKVHEHELVSLARQQGDPEKELWAQRFIASRGWVRDHYGYNVVEERVSPNIMPVAGINAIWNTVFGSVAKSSTWYIPLFTSDWNTAGATAALSNWAGASSGPLATELADASYNESGRQAATFGTAASAGVLTSSAATRYTLATGVSGVTIEGAVLTNVATVAYNATDKILAAASSFGTAISGLAATHKIDLEYALTGTSSES